MINTIYIESPPDLVAIELWDDRKLISSNIFFLKNNFWEKDNVKIDRKKELIITGKIIHKLNKKYLK